MKRGRPIPLPGVDVDALLQERIDRRVIATPGRLDDPLIGRSRQGD
jgi:hypothetical protein